MPNVVIQGGYQARYPISSTQCRNSDSKRREGRRQGDPRTPPAGTAFNVIYDTFRMSISPATLEKKKLRYQAIPQTKLLFNQLHSVIPWIMDDTHEGPTGPATVPSPKKLHLTLALPYELRIMIYHHLLNTTPHQIKLLYHDEFHHHHRRHLDLHPAILTRQPPHLHRRDPASLQLQHLSNRPPRRRHPIRP